jgi:membrane-associated protease RseP (regulator of RpoE activity)
MLDLGRTNFRGNWYLIASGFLSTGNQGFMQFIWFLLLLVVTGALMYVVIVRQVKKITQTPVWLLWLVLMAPILCLVLWRLLSGGQSLPPVLFFLLLIVSFLAYANLLVRGRINSPPEQSSAPERPDDPARLAEVGADGSTTEAKSTKSKPVRALSDEEENQLRDCFPWSTYYVQNFEYRPQAVICWGQLRAPAEEAYKKIQANVRAAFGERFLVLLQEGQNRKPIFAIVTNPQVTPEGQKLQQSLDKPSWGITLALLSFLTTTWAGYEMVKVLPTGLHVGPTNLLDGLPYACAWMGFFGVRELGYYLTARRYRVPVTLPYFIPLPPLPSLPIGTLGAFIQLRSPVPSRKILFDIRAVGSLLGLVLAIGLLAFGLTQSVVVDAIPNKTPSIFDFEGLKPQFSLLLACLSKWALGAKLTADKLIALHPIAFAGWLGVLFSAFNLMPIGSLDGGRIVHAVYGQRVGAIIGNVARWLLLALSLSQSHLLLWALLLFLLPTMDEPALNDVTELNGWRDLMGVLMLAVLLVIIMPAPASLLAWLGLA